MQENYSNFLYHNEIIAGFMFVAHDCIDGCQHIGTQAQRRCVLHLRVCRRCARQRGAQPRRFLKTKVCEKPAVTTTRHQKSRRCGSRNSSRNAILNCLLSRRVSISPTFYPSAPGLACFILRFLKRPKVARHRRNSQSATSTPGQTAVIPSMACRY